MYFDQPPTLLRAVFLFFFLPAATSLARADTVELLDAPPFHQVTLRDFSGTHVIFRGVSGEFLRVPLTRVSRLEIDSLPDFGAAEQARAAADWATAAQRFQQLLLAAPKPWQRALIRKRLVDVYEFSGQFGPAVQLIADLIATSPDPALPPFPRAPGPVGSATNQQAREALRRALASAAQGQANSTPDHRADPPSGAGGPAGGLFAADAPAAQAREGMRSLLLELDIYDELPNLPAPSSHRPAPLATGATTEPALGILPAAPTTAPAPQTAPAPTTQPAEADFAPRLHRDSLLLDCAEAALRADDHSRALRLLERGFPYVPPDEREPWRLLLGRARLECGRAAEAAADLLQLATHTRDSEMSCKALYYVGLAHERLRRTDVAAQVYRDLLRRENVPGAIREAAEAGLKRATE